MKDPLIRTCAELIRYLEPAPLRHELDATPERVARAWRELTAGYAQDPLQIAVEGVFVGTEPGLVAVREISFCSVCEHHLLPFLGHCDVAYLPQGKLIGFSKIVRVVEALCRRLQVQERLGEQVADVLEQALAPKALAVVMEAKHLCMMVRGVRQEKAMIRTVALRGVFAADPASREDLWRTLA
jgi:GTP cyclohydrolase I